MKKLKRQIFWVGKQEGETPAAEGETPPAEGETPPAEPNSDKPWFNGLSEDLQNHDQVKGVDSLEDFVANAIKSPDPIALESYQLEEGMDSKELREVASKYNISPEGLSALIEFNDNRQATSQQALDDQNKEELTSLVESWGDQAEHKLNLTNNLINQYDTDGEMAKMLKMTGAGNHPVVVKFFTELASAMEEDGFLKLREQAPAPKKSAAQTIYPNEEN